MKEAQELITAQGANAQVASLVRGGVQGTLSIVAEYADSEAYGAFMDKVNADDGWQSFMARAQSAAAAQPIRSVDYTELPGLELSFDDVTSCTVAMASVFRIHDGQQERSLERIQRWKKISERQGAKCRAMSSVASEPAFLTATVSYYDNFAEWGRIGQALGADPEWQAFGAEIRGGEASADFLRTSLMRII
jgi:hypothetical protein